MRVAPEAEPILESDADRPRSIRVRAAAGPALLFLLNLFLIYPLLTPRLGEMSLWDEAAYIHGGRSLASGSIPSFAANPLTAAIYALTYLPVRGSPFWMIYSAWIGRFLQFGLLWLSMYLIARELPRPSRAAGVAAIFLLSPVAVELTRFPSDGVFAAMAGFSFWKLLQFHNRGQLRDLGWASAFMGLAALARNDGLVVEAILVVLAVVFGVRRKKLAASVAASTLPFLALVGGYVLLAGLRTGDFTLGTMARTYDNFESGQQAVYRGTGQMDLTIEAHAEARRIFGTPEENGYSVFRAIARNPRAYLERVVAVTKGLPRTLLYAYGIRLAVPILLLAGRGLIELLRQRRFLLAAVFVLWPMHLATGFLITIFREGHLRFPYFVVFGLAGIGLGALVEGLRARREVWGWLAALAAFALYGVIDEKVAVYYGAAIFAIGILTCWLVARRAEGEGGPMPLAFSVLLAAGLVIRGGFPTPEPRDVGQDEMEQAILYLRETFDEGSVVAASTPGVIWASGMRYLGLTADDAPIDRPPEGVLEWLRGEGAAAVYVDDGMRLSTPIVWQLISPLIGHGLEYGYVGEENDVYVLIVSPAP